MPEQFLSELITLNGRVQSAETDVEVNLLIKELEVIQRRLMDEMSGAFDLKQLDKAFDTFRRLTFYSSALKRAQDKLTL
jgi:hypothetical protein